MKNKYLILLILTIVGCQTANIEKCYTVYDTFIYASCNNNGYCIYNQYYKIKECKNAK